jgi:hypothetical protein
MLNSSYRRKWLTCKERGSFLKKRTKKLLLVAGGGSGVARARKSKSFFASFFSKKEVLTYLLPNLIKAV